MYHATTGYCNNFFEIVLLMTFDISRQEMIAFFLIKNDIFDQSNCDFNAVENVGGIV